MTRIAIVAPSEKLRVSLAAALRTNPEFEVIGASASTAELPPSADLILVARVATASRVAGYAPDGTKETVLTQP